MGQSVASVDLGETQAIAAIFADGQGVLYSGRELKAIRRSWQRVRAKVKPPTVEKRRKSKRYRQIKHLLHLISKDFVAQCYEAGVDHRRSDPRNQFTKPVSPQNVQGFDLPSRRTRPGEHQPAPCEIGDGRTHVPAY
ncbi:MAG: hypothetical protein P8074_18695 [Anaerolineales bacterium]